MSLQSCYAECASIQYPSYFPSSGNIVPIFAYYNSTTIFNTLLTNNDGFNTFCFMPGVVWLDQSLTSLGNGNIYLYACRGNEIRGKTIGHYQLFYWRAANNIIIDNFYLNCLYLNSTINFGLDFTSGNQNVTIKNNRFYSMWEGDTVHGQGSSGFSVNGVHQIWMLNNTLISTLQLSGTGFGCNYCNYTTIRYNTVVNYSSAFQVTASSNYGFNSTIEYNTCISNQPIQTGFTSSYSVGISVFGTQLYTIIRYNTITGYGYDIDDAGNTPGWNGNTKSCEPYDSGTNPQYNPFCLQFMNCVSCGPIIHNNTLSNYANGIELGTTYTSFQFNTLTISSAITFSPGYSTPVSMGCGTNSVVQNNIFIFAASVGFPYRIITMDGYSTDTGYCCANIGSISSCAENPGFVVGMNIYGNGNGTLWNQWGVVSPDNGVSPCCQSGAYGYCSGVCNAQTGTTGIPSWNTTWNFAGYPNTNINSPLMMLHREL